MVRGAFAEGVGDVGPGAAEVAGDAAGDENLAVRVVRGAVGVAGVEEGEEGEGGEGCAREVGGEGGGPVLRWGGEGGVGVGFDGGG